MSGSQPLKHLISPRFSHSALLHLRQRRGISLPWSLTTTRSASEQEGNEDKFFLSRLLCAQCVKEVHTFHIKG